MNLSLHFNGHFPGEPRLASVYWSKGRWKRWWQLEPQTVQSSSQTITTNKPTPSFLQAGCPSCCPTNRVKALKGTVSHSIDLITPSSPGVFQLYLWPLIAPGYLGEGCHASHQPSDASTPATKWMMHIMTAARQLYNHKQEIAHQHLCHKNFGPRCCSHRAGVRVDPVKTFLSPSLI